MSKQERNWLGIIGAVFAFIVVLNIISYIWFPFLPWTEERDAGKQVVEDQVNAEKAVREYEWFRQTYQDIQAQRRQIENHYEAHRQFHKTYGNDTEDWSRQAETRHSRIHTRITGTKNSLEQLVADYNARSNMDNREMFKCHLPYQVDERFAISGPPGSGQPEQPQDKYLDEADSNKKPPKPEECDGLPDKVQSNP